MRRPKILLLFCGGTITMVKDPKTRSLVPVKNPLEIFSLAPELKKYFDIDYKFIVNIDSSNMQPKYWKKIADTIYSHYSGYDGFVVTHGTDTLSYTASAVSFALLNLGKPVVFTGSQLPPASLGNDAKNNLVNAFRVASMDIAEVCIVFGQKILRANRSSKMSESAFDAFWSPVYSDLGRVRLDIELFNHHQRRNNALRPVLQSAFNEDVFVFTVTPGVHPKYFDLIVANGVKGIILEGFGAGNLPNKDKSLIESIKNAVKKKIPVIIKSQCAAGIAKVFIYQTGLTAHQTGTISAEDMTLEATITKLMWVLEQTDELKRIKFLMQKNIAGEISLG